MRINPAMIMMGHGWVPQLFLLLAWTHPGSEKIGQFEEDDRSDIRTERIISELKIHFFSDK